MVEDIHSLDLDTDKFPFKITATNKLGNFIRDWEFNTVADAMKALGEMNKEVVNHLKEKQDDK